MGAMEMHKLWSRSLLIQKRVGLEQALAMVDGTLRKHGYVLAEGYPGEAKFLLQAIADAEDPDMHLALLQARIRRRNKEFANLKG